MNFTMYANFHKIKRSNGIEAAADYAASHGFSSVEPFDFLGGDWKPMIKDTEEAQKVRRVLDSRGLSVACYSVAVNLYEEGMTPETVTSAEESLKQIAEYAAILGSPFLHHTLLLGQKKSPAFPMEKALDLIVPAAVRVAKHAHSLGVRCIYEDQGDYFNGVEGFGAFFRAVKAQCPYVGVCGDVGNTLFVDESPVDFFRAFGESIVHVHIKDYLGASAPDETPGWEGVSLAGTYYKGCTIGTGCVNVAACVEELKKVGYTGAFALENSYETDFPSGCRGAMQFLQNCMAQ